MSEGKNKFTNSDSAESFLKKTRPKIDVNRQVDAILSGSKVALSQTITLLESQIESQSNLGQKILANLPTKKEPAKIIGITGSPGVGKSSFIEQLGLNLIDAGLHVAVLAIDPSSQVSKGSILGDKTRMERLSNADNAYIRPSAAGETLGGVARTTQSSIVLCEKAGYDVILIETVGVGQSEVLVHAMSDMMLLLLQPGAGDELQGIKKGVVELADLLVVNKNDSDKKEIAKQTRQYFANAIHMLSQRHSDWVVKVLLCSAAENTGIDNVWDHIKTYFNIQVNNGQLLSRRKAQSAQWYDTYLHQMILSEVLKQAVIKSTIEKHKKQLENGEIPLFQALESLQNELLKLIVDN